MSNRAGTFIPRTAALSNSLELIAKLAINLEYYNPIRRTRRDGENSRVSPCRSRHNGSKVGFAEAEEIQVRC